MEKNEQRNPKFEYQVAKAITKSEYYFVCRRENAVCSVNGNKSKIIMIQLFFYTIQKNLRTISL